jgi:sulfur relay (sulfurtransferase) DsrF/TusC family protein
MKIVFVGCIGRLPVGGQAWSDLHYLLGLQSLGHEVIYLEDCGEESWVYDWETQQMDTSLDLPARYIHDCLEPWGFGKRWIYRTSLDSRGLSPEALAEACAEADLLLLRGVPLTIWRPEYLLPPRRIFIDVDPGFTQVKAATGDPSLLQTLAQCHRLFSFGLNLGSADCPIPTLGHTWHPTLPPIHRESWGCDFDAAGDSFLAVMQWRSYAPLQHDGLSLGNKDLEFPPYLDLPRLTGEPFLLALTGGDPPLLERHGWTVREGWRVSLTPADYRTLILSARAEFAVAKAGYVTTHSGWFSDRTASFLAAGRPALVQRTGVETHLPVGEGLLTFGSPEEAIAGVAQIRDGYSRHRERAVELAATFLDSRLVLNRLLDQAMA